MPSRQSTTLNQTAAIHQRPHNLPPQLVQFILDCFIHLDEVIGLKIGCHVSDADQDPLIRNPYYKSRIRIRTVWSYTVTNPDPGHIR